MSLILSQQMNPNATNSLGPSNNCQQEKEASCNLVHLPYNEISLPFTCRILKCRICGKGRVPDVLFTTVEPPKGLEINGRGCFLQAKILRLKRCGIYCLLNFLSSRNKLSFMLIDILNIFCYFSEI